MQILPTDTSSSYGFFSSASDDAGSGFMDAMNDALGAVRDGDTHSVSSALDEDEERGQIVESPYTRATYDGVTYTLSEVCFTKQELAELRAALIREGAPQECLDDFDVLAGQPDGATLAQVIASLYGKKGAPQISEEDEQSITSMLAKIDPSGQLAGDALHMMRNGNGIGALDLIQQAFNQLDPSEQVEIDLDEMMALGRGLGLDNGSLGLLAHNFQGFSALRVNAGQFQQLVSPANDRLLADAANMDKLDAALEKTLKPIISKARDRMEKEKAASELENRRVQQSRVLIDRTVQAQSREMLDATLAGEKTVMDQAREDPSAAVKQHLNGNGLEAQMRKGAANSGTAEAGTANAKAALGQQQENAGHFAADDRNQPEQDMARENQSQWSGLLSKVETNPAAARDIMAGSVVYSMLGGLEAPATGQNIPAGRTDLPAMSRQVASQVEQGLLTALRDGATRLDLQLHPAELGTVAITLIARNGELSAQIRSEKSETAEMLQRQMDTIRVTLEQQGIKVDKIEVQVQQDDRNGDFLQQNLDQHNARQQEDARRTELARLKNLAAVRGAGYQDGQELAQPLHESMETARYAGQAMHLVA